MILLTFTYEIIRAGIAPAFFRDADPVIYVLVNANTPLGVWDIN